MLYCYILTPQTPKSCSSSRAKSIFLALLLQCTSIDRCALFMRAKKNNIILLNFYLLFHLKNIFSFFLFLSPASLLSSFFLLIFFSLPHLLFASLICSGSSSSSSLSICSGFIFIVVACHRPILPSLPSHHRPTRLASLVSIVLGFSSILVHADPLPSVAFDGPHVLHCSNSSWITR